MRNVSDDICGENKNTPSLENHAFCEILWKNIVQPGRSQMKLWLMRIA
jgi:hypothetical protein